MRNTVNIRLAEISDVPMLAQIECACFSEPWSEKSLAETLANPLARLLCAVNDGGMAVGYAGVYLLGEDADITNVAVLPAYRRQGIADALLAAMETLCMENAVLRLHLEVRQSNAPALALYEKHGFACDGRRKNYYKNPREDAILMTRTISPQKVMK